MSLTAEELSSLRAGVESAGLHDHANEVLALARRCARLSPRRLAAGETGGLSRVCGAPDLPPGLAWPEHDGRSLSFVCQVDLAALPAGAAPLLPRAGLLSFFLGCDRSPGPVAHRLFLFAPGDGLSRVAPPAALAGAYGGRDAWRPCALEIAPAVTLPYADHDLPPALRDDDVLVSHMREMVEWCGSFSALGNHVVDACGDPRMNHCGHALGTLPWQLSADEQDDAVRRYECLLWLESEAEPGFLWGAAGALALTVEAAAAAWGDWSQTHVSTLSS